MSTSRLAERNCYSCTHHSVCSFYHEIQRTIDHHLSWVNVDMKPVPDWQRLYETLAEMCLRFKPEPKLEPKETTT